MKKTIRQFLDENPGSTAKQIADALGRPVNSVRGEVNHSFNTDRLTRYICDGESEYRYENIPQRPFGMGNPLLEKLNILLIEARRSGWAQ